MSEDNATSTTQTKAKMAVAIMIPTKGRPEFVERTIRYYHSIKCPYPIYIGDASDSSVASRMMAFIQTYPSLDVRYFHLEGLPFIKTIVKLAQDAVKDCGFCAFQGDDDYFVPGSLSVCAEFLNSNSTYRTAQGRGALFVLDRPGPYGTIRGVGDYWGINELEQASGKERLLAFAQHYFVNQFSVHRTSEFLEDSFHYQSIRDPQISELLHCFTFAIMGKSKFLDCLYLVRNSHEGRADYDFVDWVTSDHFASDYGGMISALANALHLTDDISHNKARQIILDVMKRRVKSASLKMPRSAPNKLSARFRQIWPVWAKNRVRELFLGAQDLRLLTSTKSRFFAEFQPVLQSVSDSC